MKNTHEYLESIGYRCYPENKIEYPYVNKVLYQKKAASLVVCETNESLFINIHMHQFIENNPSYTVGIIAEQGGLRWRLEAYSLSEKELLKNLESIESNLLKMFNNVLGVQVSDTTTAKSGGSKLETK